jgi:hypothetical protein
MKLDEPPHRRGEGRLSSTVPWERKGETPLRDPISGNYLIDSLSASGNINKKGRHLSQYRA